MKIESELLTVDIELVDPNPFRMLKQYPFRQQKLEALISSIENIGMFEGIIARRNGKRFEQAFGHYRKEAAKRAGLRKIPLVIRDLGDEQMLQLMAHENLEEAKHGEFLDMLNSWEAAVRFIGDRDHAKSQDSEIAAFLGWARTDGDNANRLTPLARACSAAFELISRGHLGRDDFRDMSIESAKLLAEQTKSNIAKIEKDANELAKRINKPIRTEHVQSMQKTIAKAAKRVAEGVRSGEVRMKDIRSQIDFRVVDEATSKQKESPLFAAFGKRLVDSLLKILDGDTNAEKLEQVAEAVNIITRNEDEQIVRAVDYALSKVERRAGEWRKRIKRRGEEIRPFNELNRLKEFRDLLEYSN